MKIKTYLQKSFSTLFLLGTVFSLTLYAYKTNIHFTQTASAAAIDYYVSPAGNDTNDGSQAHPFFTIQKAADMAVPGTTVHVLQGTYAPVTINTSGTALAPITFISDTKWGASIVGSGNGSTKSYLVRNNASYIHFIGFDMTGIGVTNGLDNFGSYNLVQGNHIHNMINIKCTGSPGGAALGDDAGSNNTYDGNMVNNIGDYPTKCDYVHAIYVDDTGDIVTNNITYNNVGNGLYTNHGTGSVLFANNLSYANKEYGVGVNGSASGNIVENNILIGNGIAGIKTWSGTSNTQITDNILYNNAANYLLNGSAIQTGNVIADPQLVNYQANGTGDYHLKATSPAIDTASAIGAPLFDYDGNLRPQGLGFDIGPYEFVVIPTVTPTMTVTPTNIPTPTISPTPTDTPTPTITETLTPTPTVEITPSPTDIPTPTETPTVTPSPTNSPTPTVTPSPTPTATATPIPSPTASPTPSPTPIPVHVLADSPISSLIQSTNSTTISWSHTVGTQSNRLLMVQIVTYDPSYNVSTVTYNGIALSQLAETPCGGTTSCRNEVWSLLNPPSGTHTITATTSHSARLTGAAISFFNVDQTNPFGTPAINTGHTTSSSVTATTNSTQYAIDFYGNQAYSTFTPSPGAGQTQLVSAGQRSVEDIAISTKTAGASSTTFTWSWSSTNGYADIALGINPSLF